MYVYFYTVYATYVDNPTFPFKPTSPTKQGTMRKLTVLKANHRGVVVVIRTRLPWETKSTNGCCFWMNLDKVYRYISVFYGDFWFFSKWCSHEIKLVGEFLGLSQLQICTQFCPKQVFFFHPFFWPHMDADTNTSQLGGPMEWWRVLLKRRLFLKEKGAKKVVNTGPNRIESPFISWFFARNGRNCLDSLRFCKVPQIGDARAPTVWNGWMATAMIWPMKFLSHDTWYSCLMVLPLSPPATSQLLWRQPWRPGDLVAMSFQDSCGWHLEGKGGDGGNMGGRKHGKTWGKILRRENGSSK